MIACTSPAGTARCTPFRIGLPATVAWRLVISSMRHDLAMCRKDLADVNRTSGGAVINQLPAGHIESHFPRHRIRIHVCENDFSAAYRLDRPLDPVPRNRKSLSGQIHIHLETVLRTRKD